MFAARDLEKHTMVIEYIGELIRNEVAEKREKEYEQQHRGIYMFRLLDDIGKRLIIRPTCNTERSTIYFLT